MNCNVIRATTARHIIARRKEEIKVGRPRDGANEEVLLIAINYSVSGKTPGGSRSSRVECHGLPRSSCVRVDIEVQFGAVWVIQRDCAANGEVSR